MKFQAQRGGRAGGIAGRIFTADRRVPLWSFVLIVAAAAALGAALYVPVYRYGLFGSIDFVQYWSADRLFRSGGNGYSALEMRAFQDEYAHAGNHPTMFWAPPWTLLFLMPVLRCEFFTACRCWAWCGFFLWAAAAVVIWRLVFCRPEVLLPVSAAICFFFPLFNTLQFGQLGAFLLFFVALLYAALVQKRPALAGLCLVPLTVKPHLFLLLGVVLAWSELKERRVSLFVSFAVGFTLVLGVCEMLYPGAVAQWAMTFGRSYDAGGVPTVFWWVPASLVGILRLTLGEAFGWNFSWVTWLVPGAASLGVCLWLLRAQPVIDWCWMFPLVLLGSVLFAPYAWMADFSILLPVHMAAVAVLFAPCGTRRVWLILALLAPQAAAWGMYAAGFELQHQYFWFPVALLAVWLMAFNDREEILAVRC